VLLFYSFANPEPFRPRAESVIWAIHESIHRLDPFSHAWRTQEAPKSHACVRGCSIQPGHTCVLHAVGAGWGHDCKFCVNYAAMIFYFMEVHQLPPYSGTHWDPESECSVRIEDKPSH